MAVDAEKVKRLVVGRDMAKEWLSGEDAEAYRELILGEGDVARIGFCREVRDRMERSLALLGDIPQTSKHAINLEPMTEAEAESMDECLIGYGSNADKWWADAPLGWLEWTYKKAAETVRYYHSNRVQRRIRAQEAKTSD